LIQLIVIEYFTSMSVLFETSLLNLIPIFIVNSGSLVYNLLTRNLPSNLHPSLRRALLVQHYPGSYIVLTQVGRY
jgi:hypothetical protein